MIRELTQALGELVLNTHELKGQTLASPEGHVKLGRAKRGWFLVPFIRSATLATIPVRNANRQLRFQELLKIILAFTRICIGEEHLLKWTPKCHSFRFCLDERGWPHTENQNGVSP